MVTLSCGIGLLSGVSHEQETRSPSKITRKRGSLSQGSRLQRGEKNTQEQGPRPQFSTFPGCTDQPATRPSKFHQPNICMRAQGGARLFFGFRVPALFVISAPPAKIRLLLTLRCFATCRPIILRTYRTLPY